MDNYDVVIERTVRDLFKSSPLAQIKKFKINKEKEIAKRDEDLRNLILEKYPILIKSISSLEFISGSLNDLQEIRHKFGENVRKMEDNLNNENVYKFNNNNFLSREFSNSTNYNCKNYEEEQFYNNTEDSDDFEEVVSDSLDKCWILIQNEENYDNLLISLINIHRNLKKIVFNTETKFLFENLDFILIQFIENLMKNFMSIKFFQILKINSQLEKYFVYFFAIFNMVNKIESLNLSEFYFKIKSDSNINIFYKDIFNNETEINPNDCENTSSSRTIKENINSTIQLIIKLILLKLSKNFNSLSNISLKESDINTIIISDIVDIYRNTYLILLITNKIFSTTNSEKNYIENENLNNSDSNSNISNISFTSDEELNEMKNEKALHHNIFNLKNILSQIKIIFSISEDNLLGLFDNFRNSKIKIKFLHFVKNEIKNNFILQNQNILPLNVISFWQISFNNIKNIFKNKKYLKVINKILNEELATNYNENDEESLFSYLFLDKALQQINQIFINEFNKIDFSYFRCDHENKGYLNESNIFKIIKELYDQSKETSSWSTLLQQIKKSLETYIEEYLIKSEKKIKENLINKEKINFNSRFIAFIVNFFGDKKMKYYLRELNFKKSLDFINNFFDLFFENVYGDIEIFMNNIKGYLLLENYTEDNVLNIDECSLNTNSICELSKYFKNNLNFDNLLFDSEKYLESGIKFKILAIVISNYLAHIKKIITDSEKIFNNRIFNDMILLNNLLENFDDINDGSDTEEVKINFKNEIFEILKTNQKTIECKNVEMNSSTNYLFLFFIPKSIIIESKDEITIFKLNLTNQINSDLKKELIPFHSKLNSFMILKNEIKTTKQQNNLNANSTSKLLELRIDENYLSLKQPIGVNKNEITNRLENTSDIHKQFQNNIKQNTNSATYSSSQGNFNMQSGQGAQANIKEYLGFFGGKLKENISKMAKSYISNLEEKK